MRTLRKLRDNFDAYLFDSSVYIKDRTFVLFSICEILALLVASVAGVFIGDPPANIVVGFAALAISALPLYFCVKKGKIRIAKVFMSLVLVCVLRPAAFFAKGGISNGSLIMFLMGAYYLVLVLDGKFRVILCLIDTTIFMTCVVVAYYYPELLPEYSRRNDFYNAAVQYLIGLIVLTVLITFWTRILQKEAKIADEKSKELEELNRSQNRFFSSMSHEIRTPINTVLGMNEIILRQEDASDEIKKDARNIQGAGKLLLALINDILDISKIEAGKMDIVPVNYNVSSLLSEIVNMIWLKAEEKGLKFNVDIDPNVPEILYGDEVRIKQVLINLLNNAVKYTKEGSVSLHMECDFLETDEAYLKINVSDTGMGIKPEALPHLFDTFQRVDEEKNRHIEGTGLGLSIVKQLVELMDGEITVNSVYGEGSVFAVTVRQGISSDKRIGDINVSNAGSMGSEEKFEHSFHAPGARILIVDDNEMNLQVESKLLEGTEMTVDLAVSGTDALAMTLQYRYDVIFMDHLMPEMDGIECFLKIRAQKGGLNTGVPIIVLTANAGGENIELYNNTGFDGYLVKPVSGRQLEDMLVRHLSPEKVINSKNKEMTGSAMNTASGYVRKRSTVIACSSMIDLPQQLIKELDISINPFTVITQEGVFLDGIDIDADELISYMGEENRMVTSDPASEETFIRFYSSELKKAHNLIYITLSTGSSIEYTHAISAAKTFENVTVVNSESLSSSTGILVLIAARLAQQNQPVERIISELEEARKLLRCSFVIRSTETMARRGQISRLASNVFNVFWLRPVLRMKNDKLGLGGLLFGSDRRCYERYIRWVLPANVHPDPSFVFITYAGIDEEELLWIRDRLLKRVNFDKVIFQKASAGITSNCGAGSLGILYMIRGNRNYNLGAFFSDEDEGDYEDLADEEVLKEVSGGASDAASEETKGAEAVITDDVTVQEKEPEWYETIPGLDIKAAVKNSGSKDAFLSVLKIYYDTYEAKSGEIQGYYDTEDWPNYTIKVHALKSSSRLVGALKLGDDAEALEAAGKEADEEFIRTHHEDMMDQYRTIREALAVEFGAAEDRPDIPPDMLADAYGGLTEFAGAMDYELAKMVMDSVKEYKLPTEDEERFKRLEISLSKMNWDEIKEILKEAVS